MPPRHAVETIADLVAKLKEGRARPVDVMLFYKALQQLDPADASRMIEETTAGAYAVVPTTPPAEWNPQQRRAYRIFLAKAKDWMTSTPPSNADPAPDA